MTVSRITPGVFAGAAVPLFSMLVVLACGRVDGGLRTNDAATSPPASESPPEPTFPPAVELPLDATVRDEAHPDGGPPPTFPCADAAPELRCPLPASSCIDDHLMRYYTNPQCDDGTGQCTFTPVDLECFNAGVPPDCFMGGCRRILVR